MTKKLLILSDVMERFRTTFKHSQFVDYSKMELFLHDSLSQLVGQIGVKNRRCRFCAGKENNEGRYCAREEIERQKKEILK
jgi:hypothetical protein